MSAGRLLTCSRAALVVIDMQEGFRSYETFAPVAAACGRLVAGARILAVPTRATEQYPKGLGHTVPEIGLNGMQAIEKTVFSACRAEGFELDGRDQVIVCGIEAHVCVSQTVHDLLEDGREVHVAVDAVGSRHAIDREYGLKKMDGSGAILTTVEAALLELCGRAGTPEFKAVQKVII